MNPTQPVPDIPRLRAALREAFAAVDCDMSPELGDDLRLAVLALEKKVCLLGKAVDKFEERFVHIALQSRLDGSLTDVAS